VLLHPEPMCQWDTLKLLCASGTQRRPKRYASRQYNASVRFSSWTLSDAKPGKLSFWPRDKESAWQGSRDLIGQSEASVKWSNACKLGRVPEQRKCRCKLVRGIPRNCSLMPSRNGKLLIPKQWSVGYQRFKYK